MNGLPHNDELLLGAGDSGVQPAPVVGSRIAMPSVGAEDDLLCGTRLHFVASKCNAEVEEQPEGERRRHEAFGIEIVHGIDRRVAAELVAIEDAFEGNPIVRELNGSVEPVFIARLYLFDDTAHAVEDWRRVAQANDDVSRDRFGVVPRHQIDVGPGFVGADDDGHIETEAFVRLADDFMQTVLGDGLDLDGVGEAWQVAGLTHFVGELDNGVAGGLPVDFFEPEVRIFEDGFTLDGWELPVITDQEYGELVTHQIAEELIVEHGRFIYDDTFDVALVDEQRRLSSLPPKISTLGVLNGLVDEAVDGADVTRVVNTGSFELASHHVGGFAGEGREGSAPSVTQGL